MNEYNKRSAWVIVAILGCLTPVSLAQAASFDCAKAQTTVEKLICADAGITKLDETLNAAYKTALQNEKLAEAIRQAQKQWLKERNRCANAVCVKRTYEDRLKALGMSDRSGDSGKVKTVTLYVQANKTKSAGQAFSQMPPKLRYAFCDKNKPELYCEGQTGKGYSVCEAYLKHLQTLTNLPICEAPIPPGFKQPDWEEMDVMQHLDLAYQAEGLFLKHWGGYKHPDFDTWRQTFVQEIQDGKISPLMRKARVTPNDKGNATILAYTRDRDACHKVYGADEPQNATAGRRLGRPPKSYWSSQGDAGQLWVEPGSVHFILSDDTPQTLQVIVGDVSRRNTDLLLFSGRPYLFGTNRLYRTHDRATDISKVIVYAFDPRLPDRTRQQQLDLNIYMAEPRCQFLPY